jgi:copper(I)-binding protein
VGRLTAARAAATVPLGLTLLGACAPRVEDPGIIAVTDVYAAEPVSRETGAVYLTIENRADAPDTLIGAWTPIASMAHLHTMAGAAGAAMETSAAAEIPAGGALQLRPGGLHLMLMTITAMPHAGDTIDLHLEFAHAGAVTVRVPVLTYLEVSERAAVGAQRDSR